MSNPIIIVTGDSEGKQGGGQSLPGSSVYGHVPHYNVNIKTEMYVKNQLLRPDGFSQIWFENVGTDRCKIFDSVPVDPESNIRKFEFDPGQVISTQINIVFENMSVDKRLLITKIYYEKI